MRSRTPRAGLEDLPPVPLVRAFAVSISMIAYGGFKSSDTLLFFLQGKKSVDLLVRQSVNFGVLFVREDHLATNV